MLKDCPNQSLLACWLFSLACLALLCSSPLHEDNEDYPNVPLASSDNSLGHGAGETEAVAGRVGLAHGLVVHGLGGQQPIRLVVLEQ